MMKGGQRTAPVKIPFVSIITVVYNSRALIENTIKSVIGQSSDDYQYVVIDGNSTDGTLDVIQQYDSTIDYWQSEPDKGLYDAMNKGLKLANGKFVLFLNSGDLLESPDTITSLKFKSSNADILFGETNLIDHTGSILGSRSELTTRKLPSTLNWRSLLHGMVVSHQSILVARNIAPAFDTNYRCSADIDWVIRSLKTSNHVVNADMVISRYLIGGFSGKNAMLAVKERFQIFVKHYGWINSTCAYIFIAFRSLIFKLRRKRNF